MTSLTALLSKWPLIRQIRRRADGTGLEAMSDKTRAMHARTDLAPVLHICHYGKPSARRQNVDLARPTRERMKIEAYLFIAGGLIFMAGVQPEIISAAEDSATYATSQPIEKGQAPGMQVQLLSENHGRREYAVIFSKGDEAFSGLNEFAEKFHVTSARVRETH
jgi:hypothetical protein